jgi:hypothetical protein
VVIVEDALKKGKYFIPKIKASGIHFLQQKKLMKFIETQWFGGFPLKFKKLKTDSAISLHVQARHGSPIGKRNFFVLRKK